MAGIPTSLFPPIVDTYMPAFIVGVEESSGNSTFGDCRIYFSLSKYNSLDDIKSVWVAVNNQFTNKTVLTTKTGLKSIPAGSIETDPIRGDDRYFITLHNEDIDGGWALNQLYKVQLRFYGIVDDLTDDSPMSDVTSRESNFSEWSTVCLIQGIQVPELEINNFDDSEAGSEVIFTSMDNSIVGRVNFKDNEQLESYQIKFYKQSDLENVIFDSGVIYTNEYNPNEINYFVKYAFIEGEQYRMKFSYATQSLYTETREYDFSIIGVGGEMLNAKISAEQNEEEGCITIRVTSDTERFFGNLTIRRASSETDFSIWEDVHTTEIKSEDFLDFTWYDYTVESGIWYKYCVQKRNVYGDRGLIVPIKDPVMVTLQDMFLTRADRQLKIKFNPQVSSFKRTVSESLTQTLGSKYPFIKRNSNVGYRQFSISGLISHFSDENERFCTKDSLYRGHKELYDEYNEENRINEYNDFSLEKTFREQVQDFLYEHNVKLFRSPSEGNILVKLMDISFTPNQTLGRMVYNFSATAYEVDEINFENFEKYGIQKVGTYSETIKSVYSRQGHYQLDSFYGETEFKDLIQKKEELTPTKGLKKTVTYLTKVDIQFESKPYLINTDGDTPSIVNQYKTTNQNTVLGYLIKVNGQYVVVGPSGKYALKGDEVKINSLHFMSSGQGDKVFIDYSCIIEETEDRTNIARQVSYTARIGQVRGWFKPTTTIIEMIQDKYNHFYNKWYQRLFAINSIEIEAEPNTVCYIKDTSHDTFKRYMIGETGFLKILDEDFSIDGIFTLGTHVSEKKKIMVGEGDEAIEIYENERTKDLEYEDCSNLEYFNSTDEIHSPVKNGVYIVKNIDNLTIKKEPFSIENDYFNMLNGLIRPYKDLASQEDLYKVIYFEENWCVLSRDNDVIKPCQAQITYYYELEKGEY